MWKEKCPIKRYRVYLLENKILTEEQANQIEKDAYASIDAAVEVADKYPEPDVDTLEEGVYA
jgi:TPP-dependent pyruvate/acetoin dehydrogenase alpha subunit